MTLGKLGKYAKATEWFDKALDTEPNNDISLTNKSIMKLDKLGRQK